MKVTEEQLIDSLNLLAMVAIRKIEINPMMVGLYLDDLDLINYEDFDRALKYFYNCRLGIDTGVWVY